MLYKAYNHHKFLNLLMISIHFLQPLLKISLCSAAFLCTFHRRNSSISLILHSLDCLKEAVFQKSVVLFRTVLKGDANGTIQKKSSE